MFGEGDDFVLELARATLFVFERALEDEKRRAGELEDKVIALAEQLRDVPGTMGSFFHP